MKILNLSVIVLLCVLLRLSASEENYHDTINNKKLDNLETILNNPKDGQRVTLKGHIVGKVGHDRYLFSDEKRSIYMNIDNEDLPEVPITEEGTILRITGEIRQGFFSPPEIKTTSIEILQQGNIRNITRKVDSVSKVLITNETDQKVELIGEVTLFIDDDEFVLKEDNAYIQIDVDGAAKKELANINEGDRVYVSGTIKSKRFYFRNNATRNFVKVRKIVKQDSQEPKN